MAVSLTLFFITLGVMLIFPVIMRFFENVFLKMILYVIFSGGLVVMLGIDAAIVAPLMLLTVYFASMAVADPRVMRAAIYLLMAMVLLGFIYIFLNSEILMALHISVYGGGIAILILFAAVLIEENTTIIDEQTMRTGYLITVILAFTMGILTFRGRPEALTTTTIASLDDGFALVNDFSVFLWTTYNHVIPFLAMLILGALIGAVRLALTDKEVINELGVETEEVSS